MTQNEESVRALCVGRHHFLAEHLARFFTALGVEATQAVGLEDALVASRNVQADLVICEYELLATLSLEAWERDELLSHLPVIAVSLTRKSHEAHLLDVNGIAGFLYLPVLDREAAVRLMAAAASSSRARYVPLSPSSILSEETQPR